MRQGDIVVVVVVVVVVIVVVVVVVVVVQGLSGGKGRTRDSSLSCVSCG